MTGLINIVHRPLRIPVSRPICRRRRPGRFGSVLRSERSRGLRWLGQGQTEAAVCSGWAFLEIGGNVARVLVVDDSLLIRKQLCRVLTDSLGHEVVGEAKDGEEAVALYQQQRPDLVTLDLSMPKKIGMVALAEILALDPDARVVVVSAVVDAHSVSQALEAGARGFVHKPLRTQDGSFVDRFGRKLADALDDSSVPAGSGERP